MKNSTEKSAAMPYPLVVFDLDGTILDSLRFTFKALDFSLSPILGRTLKINDLIHLLESSDVEMIQKVAGRTQAEAAILAYLEYYRRHPQSIKPFNEIIDLLMSLKLSAVPTAIVTSRSRASTDILLEQTEIEKLVDRVVAADDGPRRKPAPDAIFHVARELGVSPSPGFMIGDGPDDILCGRAAGLTTVATRWCGLIPLEQVQEKHPDFIIESVQELVAILERQFEFLGLQSVCNRIHSNYGSTH